jgi:host factor-I protein
VKKEKRLQTQPKLQHLHYAAHGASRNAVIVHLSNGTRLTGVVLASDNYMVLLGQSAEDPTPTLIYKRDYRRDPGHAPETASELLEAETSPDFVRLYTPRTRKRR